MWTTSKAHILCFVSNKSSKKSSKGHNRYRSIPNWFFLAFVYNRSHSIVLKVNLYCELVLWTCAINLCCEPVLWTCEPVNLCYEPVLWTCEPLNFIIKGTKSVIWSDPPCKFPIHNGTIETIYLINNLEDIFVCFSKVKSV